MRAAVRATGLLLLLALAGLSFWQREIRFGLAGVAIQLLLEIGLALRARRNGLQLVRDRSRVSAARISCVEQAGALTLTLSGDEEGRGPTPYVLLSRPLQPGTQNVEPRCEPYLELSDGKWSVTGGIQDAYLSPHLLRLTLNARGTEALRANDICVTLETPSEQRRLERALGKVLRGVPFTSDRSLAEAGADA